ncbi:MAG: hypothetical protein Kapaf2KO_16810 [Candidatus Kapaibacteriales bacterium]
MVQVYTSKEKVNQLFDTFVLEIARLDCSDWKKELLRNFALDISKVVDIRDFTPKDSDNYDRNYLARDDSGWEILLIAWQKGDETEIHGHPELCCYHYIKGEFELELFHLCPEGNLIFDRKIYVTEGMTYSDCGEPDTFCNHIHKVKCLSDIGYSINIYSDDAKKGEEFELNTN